MRVGSGDFVYEEIRRWGEFPADLALTEVAGVAVDSHDCAYVLARGEWPVIVLDREGRYLDCWGQGQIARAHGITIGPDDMVYCVDDRGHAVRKFTPDGELLMTIETTDHPADTGYELNRPDTVLRSGPPFNRPTDVAVSPTGELYVTDGYGNARVHKFSPEGELLLSWGEPGDGPGEFRTPHGICITPDGLLSVADRGNARIQVFDLEGEFVEQWLDVHYPNVIRLDAQGNTYVAELGGVFLDWPHVRPDGLPARVTIRDSDGTVLAAWTESAPGSDARFFSPHGVAVDTRGDVYVAEIPATYTHGTAPPNWPVLRKYLRV